MTVQPSTNPTSRPGTQRSPAFLAGSAKLLTAHRKGMPEHSFKSHVKASPCCLLN